MHNFLSNSYFTNLNGYQLEVKNSDIAGCHVPSLIEEILRIHYWVKGKNYDYFSLNSLPKLPSYVDETIKKNRPLGVAWRQFFRLSPVNLRPLFSGSSHGKDPTSMIILSLAYLQLWNSTGSLDFLECFRNTTEWVISIRSKHTKNFAIPQMHQIHVRGYVAGEYDISPFVTLWAGTLFLEAYKRLKQKKYLDLATSVAKYYVDELPKSLIDDNRTYFYYVPNHGEEVRCYNCSALISSYLLQISRFSGCHKQFDYGRKGINYIISTQNRDGSWFYGNSKSSAYVDNFHTAYILLALHKSVEEYCYEPLSISLNLGLEYYKRKLFSKSGRDCIKPIHFDRDHLPFNSNLVQKVDLRDSATAIILFSLLSQHDHDDEYWRYAEAVYNWTTRNAKNRDGYDCEHTWLWRNRIPYIDFQSWILLAFSNYLEAALNRAERCKDNTNAQGI